MDAAPLLIPGGGVRWHYTCDPCEASWDGTVEDSACWACGDAGDRRRIAHDATAKFLPGDFDERVTIKHKKGRRPGTTDYFGQMSAADVAIIEALHEEHSPTPQGD